jgi:hypothetical protein
MNHFRKIFAAGQTDNLDLIACMEASNAFLDLYEVAKKDLDYSGPIERLASKIAGMTAYRYGQLQEIEAILEYLEQREIRTKTDKTRHYMEHYQRTLTESVARNYADAHQDVQDVRQVTQQVAYARNLFLGVMKGLEYLHFQISNVTKLKCAGLEDALMDTSR